MVNRAGDIASILSRVPRAAEQTARLLDDRDAAARGGEDVRELRRDVPAAEHREVAAAVRAGPSGALTLAAIASAIVVACWFAFYLFVFLPRGS